MGVHYLRFTSNYSPSTGPVVNLEDYREYPRRPPGRFTMFPLITTMLSSRIHMGSDCTSFVDVNQTHYNNNVSSERGT